MWMTLILNTNTLVFGYFPAQLRINLQPVGYLIWWVSWHINHRPQVSCSLITTIIRIRKKDIGEIKKIDLCMCVCLCVDYICVLLCVCLCVDYICVLLCVCLCVDYICVLLCVCLWVDYICVLLCVCLCVDYICVLLCVCLWVDYICVLLCVCLCVDYICVLLCVVVLEIFSMCLFDHTCAARQIWGCLLDIWVAMCSENRDTQVFDRIKFFFVCVCVCVCVAMI